MTKSFLGNTVLAGRRRRAACRRGARARGRERRGQVDADEAARRRLPARQRHHRARRQRGVASATRCRRSAPASRRCSRSSTCCPSAPSPRTSTSAASRGASGFGRHRPHAPRHRRAARRASASPTSRPGTLVRQLSVAEQQVVEIAKAVSFDAKVIQMDEPTAALADHEVELLYSIIERLTARGVAILYVSHRLKEIFDLCTTITILKDGRQVSSGPAAELTEASLVRQMVGRPLDVVLPRQARRDRGRRGPADAGGRRQPVRRRRRPRPSAPARSSASPGCRARAAPSSSRRSSACTRSTAARWRSTARPSPCAARARASAAGSRCVTEDRKAKGLALNQSILDNALGVVRAVLPSPHRRRAPRAAGRAVRASRSRPAGSTRRCSSSPAATSRRSCSRAG